jgi:pimeloyl-ACP methyl ester carboxylesterase
MSKRLDTLPLLLDALGTRDPVLFGHSDGASIAFIHAARAHRPVAAVIALAPHVFVERYGLDSIAAARRAYLDGDLRAKLARYHDDVDSAFWGWNDVWLHSEFRAWNIEALLPEIAARCSRFKARRQYSTIEQIDPRRACRNCRLELAQCGPHPGAISEAVLPVAQFPALSNALRSWRLLRTATE